MRAGAPPTPPPRAFQLWAHIEKIAGVSLTARAPFAPARASDSDSPHNSFFSFSAGREVREKMFTRVTALFHDLDAGMLPIR